MLEYSAPLRDIDFVLNHVCDLAGLAQIDRFSHAEPDLVRDLLSESGRWVSEVVAPLNHPADQAGGSVRNPDGSVTTPAGFPQAYRSYVDAGWGAVPFDQEWGGGGFPVLVSTALSEMLASANLSFSMAPLLTQGAIHAITAHGSPELCARYLEKMVTGEWTGTMNLTEPDAGSDVGALRSRAVRQADGSYLVTGNKIFITFGEHDMADNIIHLVLARTPDAPAGSKGISLFVVPKFRVNPDGSPGERNDVSCVSIEHKMGIKASPTCVLAYGENGGAYGELIGEENRGLEYMFVMMNQARLAVGLEGLSVAERAYQQALAYAQERRQGRAVGAPAGTSSPIIDHPDVRRMLLTMKATNEAMRRLIYVNAEAIDRGMHDPDAEARSRWNDIAALLTPATKAWCTDMGVEVTSLGVQVHGGVGFIEETGAAQHFRDARITPIYEGTNGIQGMDMVGRKLPLRGGEVIREHLARIGALDADLAAAGPALAGVRDELKTSLDALVEATMWFPTAMSSPNDILAGATPYLRLFSMVTAGWLMARSALAATDLLAKGATGAEAEFLEAKIVTARFFCEQLLPSAVGLVNAVRAGADTLFALSPAALAD
jgi:alkylation response protein AidB-like acyl-CoA dehydrogenase